MKTRALIVGLALTLGACDVELDAAADADAATWDAQDAFDGGWTSTAWLAEPMRPSAELVESGPMAPAVEIAVAAPAPEPVVIPPIVLPAVVPVIVPVPAPAATAAPVAQPGVLPMSYLSELAPLDPVEAAEPGAEAEDEALDEPRAPEPFQMLAFHRSGKTLAATWTPAGSGAADCVDVFGVILRATDMKILSKTQLVDSESCFDGVIDEYGQRLVGPYAKWLERLERRGYDRPVESLVDPMGHSIEFGFDQYVRLNGPLAGWFVAIERHLDKGRLKLVLVTPDNQTGFELGTHDLEQERCEYEDEYEDDPWGCSLTIPTLTEVALTPDRKRLIVEWTQTAAPCWSDIVGYRRSFALPGAIR